MVRLRKDNALFLMIDVQEKLLPAIEGHEAVQSNCLKLLKASEALKIPFIYTEQYPKGLGPTVAPLLEALPVKFDRHEKVAFSCFDEPGFSEKFNLSDRPIAVLFGIETHICVLSTVMDLVAQGRKVVVAADACGSRAHANHAMALDAARDCGAAILPTETVIYQMIGAAGTPEFKTMLPLFSGIIKAKRV